MKKGLLLFPEFPRNTFWSYRYIIRYVNRKTTFPPLGLLTFAALMPKEWEFEVVDFNVRSPSPATLRKKIQEADAVFVSAMSIQKRSLVDLLEKYGSCATTPWVLGGPFASTYRDSILDPKNPSDQVLHDGLDMLVWGEAQNWIEAMIQYLEEHPTHSEETPYLFIPNQVRESESGLRKYLNDRDLFKPLNVPVPRWDLIRYKDYRALTLQTTAGCKFRCDFCDIIQFNGGFPRAKKTEHIYQELEAIYQTGHRGSVFVVDDNILGDINQLNKILEAQIKFQRNHDYPFEFFVQSSVDLAKASNESLIEKFKEAGYNAMFFGIENPNPDALKAMNKKQNNQVDLYQLVEKFQKAGIEVFAGFIFGSDTDCTATAQDIVKFVKDTHIFTAMTGMLTPMPHTPLFSKYKQEGRLIETEYTGNNTDDEIQFYPKNMTVEEMRAGIHYILTSLFNSKELYHRALGSMERFHPHIFSRKSFQPFLIKAGALSMFKQGIKRLDFHYFHYLYKAIRLDWKQMSEIKKQIGETQRRWLQFKEREYNPHDYQTMLENAKGYLIRCKPDLHLEQVYERFNNWSLRLQNKMITPQELEEIYASALLYLKTKRELFTFPGTYLVRAFELAIKGYHYEQVMNHITVKS